MSTPAVAHDSDHLAAIARQLGEMIDQAERNDEVIAELSDRVHQLEVALVSMGGAASVIAQSPTEVTACR